MLSGLEQYLGMDELPPSPSSGDYYPEEPSSSDIAESFREKDSSRPNGLMMLLSGKQKTKRNTKKKTSPPSTSGDDSIEQSGQSSFVDDDIMESVTISQEKSIQGTMRTDEIMALEKRVYSSAQSVSALDLLQKHQKPLIVDEDVTIISESKDSLALLENRFSAARTVNAKDLFLSFGPKSSKNKKGEWTLKVCLKVSSDKLAAIKPQRQIAAAKPSLIVTLKVPIVALREIQRTLNPLFTRSSGNDKGKNANNVFAMMMKTATKNALPKLTDLQKLNGLEPPSIKRNEMHVVPDDKTTVNLGLNISAPLRFPRQESLAIEGSMDLLLDKTQNLHHLHQFSFTYTTTLIEDCRIPSIISTNAPLASNSLSHKRIYEEFISKRGSVQSNLPWPQAFQPPDSKSLLTDEESKYFLEKWIENSFKILKTQSTRIPRDVKKREQLRRQKRKLDPMGDFIVDDFEDDGEDTEEDVYLPVLIIQGDVGSCKTSSVYAAMNALNGYVHEINSGQQRSRKDLHSSLKEFCTTQIIHKSREEKTFQKGIVLFEDCDVLFEQDKNFWTVVLDVINYSRRPIVITVRDTSVIPKSIWEMAEEQDSIITSKVNDREALSQYLWLCCFAHGCILKKNVLELILNYSITSTGFDVRKSLMIGQLLCSGRHGADGSYVEINTVPREHEDLHPLKGLLQATLQLEAMSISDILIKNTPSSMLHEPIPNELLDIYIIDQTHLLTQQTLPFELNIGETIEHMSNMSIPYQDCEGDFSRIRSSTIDFISSRAKKMPRFLQDMFGTRAQTRSRSSTESFVEDIEVQGLPDNSTCYSMSKAAFILDLAPISRDWAHFQTSLFKLDSSRAKSQGESLEEYLNWRRFHGNCEAVMKTI